MDVGIFCLVLLLLTAFVARPLYERTNHPARPAPAEDEATRDAVVAALSDLEIDRASGAVDEATYASERAALEARGVELVTRLEQAHD